MLVEFLKYLLRDEDKKSITSQGDLAASNVLNKTIEDRERFILSIDNELNIKNHFWSNTAILVCPVNRDYSTNIDILLNALEMYDEGFRCKKNNSLIICIIFGKGEYLETLNSKIWRMRLKYVAIRTWNPPADQLVDLIEISDCAICPCLTSYIEFLQRAVVNPKCDIPIFAQRKFKKTYEIIENRAGMYFGDARELYKILDKSLININGKMKMIEKMKFYLEEERELLSRN